MRLALSRGTTYVFVVWCASRREPLESRLLFDREVTAAAEAAQLRRTTMSWIRLGLFGCTAAALLAACSSSTTTPSASSSGRALGPPTATAHPSVSPLPAGPLSGTWSGKYSGAYSGTFTLTWTQSGSQLSGSMQLSSPADTPNVVGLLKADTITFTTAGSTAITYAGTYSGNSMSGQYHSGASGTGTWSATKT